MSQNDDEVLVRVEGVSKKFCRSLKKSLWYGVCDIAGELLPGRKRHEKAYLTTEGTEHTEGGAGGNQRADSGEFLEGHSQAGLQMDSGKLAAIRSANNPSGSAENSSSVLISEICGPNPPALARDEDLRDGEFYAVRDVSFELRRGECLGLIGHNGAGKTTLLKMLNGLIKPDRGSITMRGRVGALIALGAGFNPILTGRENIYINGSVLGLTKKEIDEKIDEIIDFAEIREFIDMPVQSYSSGMTVRLGFAVATALDPDVLILDEVLAVGDVAFRYKCYRRIDEIRNRAAILFVSHNMPDVGRICTETIAMEKGHPVYIGPPLGGIETYNSLMNGDNTANKVVEEFKYPIKQFRIELENKIQFNNKLKIDILIDSECAIPDSTFTVAFQNNFGAFAAVGSSRLDLLRYEIKPGLNSFQFVIKNIPLKNGVYFIHSHIMDVTGQFLAMEQNKQKIVVYGSNELMPGDCQLEFVIPAQ